MTTRSRSDALRAWFAGLSFSPLLSFAVPGKPVPCPRPRVTRAGHSFYPAAYNTWRVKALAELLVGAPAAPISEPVTVVAEAVIERPKTTIRKLPGGDVDNYAKSILDALTKAKVWLDDDLVGALLIRKRWAERGEDPGFNIMVGAGAS